MLGFYLWQTVKKNSSHLMLLCIACKALKTMKTIGLLLLSTVIYLKEPFQLQYLLSFAFILGAAYFAFKNKRAVLSRTTLQLNPLHIKTVTLTLPSCRGLTYYFLPYLYNKKGAISFIHDFTVVSCCMVLKN